MSYYVPWKLSIRYNRLSLKGATQTLEMRMISVVCKIKGGYFLGKHLYHIFIFLAVIPT